MPCNFCNSAKSPNPDGTCPDCGRVVSQSDTAQPSNTLPDVNENQQYPVQHWRCTWMILLSKMLFAALMAAALVGGVWALYHYADNENLNKCKQFVWIGAIAIPSIYFLFGFFSFLFNRFIKRYELRPKEIRLIKGFLNMSTNSTILEALWGMSLRQYFFQRFFGTGRITLHSDDATSPTLYINDIGNIRKRFDSLREYQEYALDCSNVKVERNPNADTSLKYWRYSGYDLIDETFWGLLITAVSIFVWLMPFGIDQYRLYVLIGVPVVYWLCGLIWTLFRGVFFTKFTVALGIVITAVYIALACPWENANLRFFLLMSVPVFYWCWLIFTFIDKIFFTLYTLDTATLTKESGIFNKKIDVYVLCHIRDCKMSQNLWQRIIGDIGNITLYLKWDDREDKGKEVLHGLQHHKEIFDTFKERWLFERHRRQA
ncbi:MAG: PH domain-containing protein [Thermoguttaceae bacterium]|nr:PH domain-containing protein [Thermoguttaceae bacterium]